MLMCQKRMNVVAVFCFHPILIAVQLSLNESSNKRLRFANTTIFRGDNGLKFDASCLVKFTLSVYICVVVTY